MKRDLLSPIQADLSKKIILITGPRQCGKTTLSKMLSEEFEYLNFDSVAHRKIIQELSWDRTKPLVIFDELHKMDKWKAWIKGVYDVEGLQPEIVITGSANLSAFRKVGDSLAGRHFLFHLHPITFQEACNNTDLDEQEIFSRLLTVGGFPEPFFNGKKTYYNRWRRSHIDLILREDLIDLTAIRDIKGLETLIELLKHRVGSPVSANSLANDLQKSPKTVQAWLTLLENLYVIFRVSPYHKNIAKALTKQPKYYFFDNAMVADDMGARFENLIATSLLKDIHYAQDVEGIHYELFYIRNRNGYEIDFFIQKENKPHRLIEAKWQDSDRSKNFNHFFEGYKNIHRLQVVANLERQKTFRTGEVIQPASRFLKNTLG